MKSQKLELLDCETCMADYKTVSLYVVCKIYICPSILHLIFLFWMVCIEAVNVALCTLRCCKSQIRMWFFLLYTCTVLIFFWGGGGSVKYWVHFTARKHHFFLSIISNVKSSLYSSSWGSLCNVAICFHPVHTKICWLWHRKWNSSLL